MSNLTKLLRARGVSFSAALLVALASAPALVGEARAQGGQGMGNMQNMPGMGDSKATAATSASAVGTVETVNAEQRKVKLNHEPIPAFNWPAMSMEMTAAPSVDLSKVKPGSKVKFTLSKGADGTYTIQSLSAAP